MKLSALAVAFLALAATCRSQDNKTRIVLTAESSVSTAEVGKSLDKHCPDVVLTIEQPKADFLLEAANTGAGRKPYKFTLFDHTSDRVFSTETSRLDNAVKDVCAYIQKRREK
jgi:hypothetical protein